MACALTWRLIGVIERDLDRLRVSPDPLAPGASVLRLPRAVVAEMLAHVAAGYPDEACGVLAGASGRVTRHFPAANASATPRTFSEIAPRELVAIWNAVDTNGWEMLAYYHSHPAGPAYPSPSDVVWARNWPGTLSVIFSLAAPAAPVVRAYLVDGAATPGEVTADAAVREYRIEVQP